MGKKLYVGNLPFNMTEDELSSAFGQFGAVEEVFIAKDKFTGKARGFAFVTMADDSAAEEAVKRVNGSNFGGRTIQVNEARPREEYPDRGGDRGGDRGSRGDRGGFSGGRDSGHRRNRY